jgi:hypothetical protein
MAVVGPASSSSAAPLINDSHHRRRDEEDQMMRRLQQENLALQQRNLALERLELERQRMELEQQRTEWEDRQRVERNCNNVWQQRQQLQKCRQHQLGEPHLQQHEEPAVGEEDANDFSPGVNDVEPFGSIGNELDNDDDDNDDSNAKGNDDANDEKLGNNSNGNHHEKCNNHTNHNNTKRWSSPRPGRPTANPWPVCGCVLLVVVGWAAAVAAGLTRHFLA